MGVVPALRSNRLSAVLFSVACPGCRIRCKCWALDNIVKTTSCSRRILSWCRAWSMDVGRARTARAVNAVCRRDHCTARCIKHQEEQEQGTQRETRKINSGRNTGRRPSGRRLVYSPRCLYPVPPSPQREGLGWGTGSDRQESGEWPRRSQTRGDLQAAANEHERDRLRVDGAAPVYRSVFCGLCIQRG